MHARVELDVRPDEAEVVAAQLWRLGALGVWQRPDSLVAWFEAPPAALREHENWRELGLPDPLAPGRLRWSEEPDRDWQAEWKATIAPVHAAGFVIVPTWLADEHVTAPHETAIVLDPGRAFGSGHHATTTLCLELLDELDLAGRRLADIGCGTGVLAIAAVTRGAAAIGVDVDEDAILVAARNARRNDVEVTLAVGSVESLAAPAEIVVANLVTDTIVELAAALVAATSSTLVVSGIASERRERALEALVAAGATLERVRERDGWVAARLAVTRPGRATPTPIHEHRSSR